MAQGTFSRIVLFDPFYFSEKSHGPVASSVTETSPSVQSSIPPASLFIPHSGLNLPSPPWEPNATTHLRAEDTPASVYPAPSPQLLFKTIPFLLKRPFPVDAMNESLFAINSPFPEGK